MQGKLFGGSEIGRPGSSEWTGGCFESLATYLIGFMAT